MNSRGKYISAVVAGSYVFVSNTGSGNAERPDIQGIVGQTLTQRSIEVAAVQCAENTISAASKAANCSIDMLVPVYTRCTLVADKSFGDHFQLAEVCVRRMQELTGSSKEVAVSAYGARSMPSGSAIEFDTILRKLEYRMIEK